MVYIRQGNSWQISWGFSLNRANSVGWDDYQLGYTDGVRVRMGS